MQEAIDITQKRRKFQDEYNRAHGITPHSASRNIEESLKIEDGTEILRKGTTTFPAEIDLTGDSEPDVAVVSNQADKEIETAKGLSAYMIGTDGFKVSEDGFIEPADAKGIYTFKTAYYYTPVSTQDITVNPNLKQNPNWKWWQN